MKYVTAFYLIGLLGLESLANHNIRPWDAIPFGDKILHFLSLGILCWLFNRTLGDSRLNGCSSYIQIGTLVVLLGATLAECAQLFTAARTFSFVDLACSYLGIVFFAYLSVPHGSRESADT